MTASHSMRDFGLEVFFSKWEFSARHHMTASDVESLSTADLLALASDEDRAGFDDLWLGYTETWGAPDLRAEIATTYEAMTAENILCHAGAGEGIYAVMRVLLTAGDHVIVPVPNYQSAETVPLAICDVSGIALRRAGDWPQNSGRGIGEAAGDTTGGTAEWRIDLDELAASIRPNTKLLSLNMPHNPTGMVMSRADLDAVIALCRKHGLYLFCDEVYRGLELDVDDRLPPIADLYERGISLNVMSKAYGLPGLRVGWIASQDTALLQRVERYKHYLSICNSAPSERLALIALRARETILARNVALLAENVVLLEKLFADFPGLVEWRRPQGGCVGFPRFCGPEGGEVFCKRLLEEDGVLLLPSSIYVSELSETRHDHFRIGFGRDAVFKDGLAAMRAHMTRHYSSFLV
ncbi:MAG: aminotransferase class I/II-fold pyridoxal phosphate-dependent enzyme [Pseudomonadota bacterium]